MQRVIQTVLLFILAFVSTGGMASGQQPSTSPGKTNPAPTPIPLGDVPFEAQSAATSLDAIEASVARIQADADAIQEKLSKIISEFDPRMMEDTRLLGSSLSLDLLYRIKRTWRNFGENPVRISAGAETLRYES